MALIQNFINSQYGPEPIEGAYCRIESYGGNKSALTVDLGLYRTKAGAARNEDGTNQYRPFDIVRFNFDIEDLNAIATNPLAYGYERIKELWPDAKDD